MGRILKFLGSLKLAVLIFVLLFWLTFWGTLAQRDMNLYDVQVEFFESIFLVYDVGGVPIPMVGGYILLAVLFVNLLVGGMLRMRLRTRTIGILIAHFGVLFLLVGSFIEFQRKTSGHMLLFPGEQSSEYVSSNNWEVVVEGRTPDGRVREYIVPEKHFRDLGTGDTTRYSHADLPFDLVLSHYSRNATARRQRDGEHPRGAAEGLVLVPLEDVGPGDRINRPGLLATVEAEGADVKQKAILLGLSAHPWAVQLNGLTWTVDLRQVRWNLPFTVKLKKFVHKKHAGTSMAKEYSSYVDKIQPDPEKAGSVTSEEHHITMNEPMRHAGYTFYQSSYGPKNAKPGEPIYSQFAVVNNPTDKWPMISCWIIFIGLLIHFAMKLGAYQSAEAKRAERAEGAA